MKKHLNKAVFLAAISLSMPTHAGFLNGLHSCEDEFIAATTKDKDEERKIIEKEIETELENEFDGDNPIDILFQNHLFKKLDYYARYKTKKSEICQNNPDMDVAQAAIESVEYVYGFIEKKPRLALCTSLNQGLITVDNVISEMRDPSMVVTTGGSMEHLALNTIDGEHYSPNELENDLSSACRNNPESIIWSELSRVIGPAADKAERIEAKKAEEASRIAREQAREKKLNAFGVNLVESNKANCGNFKAQMKLAQGFEDRELYSKALESTLASLLANLPSHQRQAANELQGGLLANIKIQCWNDNKLLSQAIFDINEIKNAPSSEDKEIEDWAFKYRNGKCRKSDPLCVKDLDSKAASTVYNEYSNCSRSDSSSNCLAGYLDKFKVEKKRLYEKRFADRIKKIDGIMSSYKQGRNLEPEITTCKKEAINIGHRGQAYNKYVNDVCIPRISKEKSQKYLDEKVKINSILSALD